MLACRCVLGLVGRRPGIRFLGSDAAQRLTRPQARKTFAASAEHPSAAQPVTRKQPQPRKPVETHVGRSPKASSLRVVPGIGKKYESFLKAQGLTTVDQLADAYRERGSNGEKLAAYLQELGIRNKLHVDNIVSYIRELVPAGGVTVAVEGNISAGKSTFLSLVTEGNEELKRSLQIVPEPVKKWQSVGGRFNILESFYKDPERFAYTFQNYVFVTRLMQEQESRNGVQPYRLLERSVFSDRMVFVRAVHDAHQLSDLELALYESWFEPLVHNMPSLVPHGFVYLRATPDTCMRRMSKRNRGEEGGVKLEYLQSLHEKHEDWLNIGVTASDYLQKLPLQSTGQELELGGLYGPPGRLVQMQGAQGLALPDNIVNDVKLIPGGQLPLVGKAQQADGEKRLMGDLLNKIPALVLNVDHDVDLERDHYAKQFFADKLWSYIKWVERFRESQMEPDSAPATDPPRGPLMGSRMAAPKRPGAAGSINLDVASNGPPPAAVKQMDKLLGTALGDGAGGAASNAAGRAAQQRQGGGGTGAGRRGAEYNELSNAAAVGGLAVPCDEGDAALDLSGARRGWEAKGTSAAASL